MSGWLRNPVRRLIAWPFNRCHRPPQMPALAVVKSNRSLDARGPELNYVPALDGIRAIAVIVIMGYHGGLFLTNGGFYSLDTFFALSGFLITTLLVAEWQQAGRIRLTRFWARRARRLLPALLLLVVAVVTYVAIFSAPGTYGGLRLDAFSTLFYVANWHFILIGSNYFGHTGPTSPLLHTWSLAVEEQFYLFWPLIVIVVLRTRLGLRLLLGVCIAGALGSAALMAVLYSLANQNRVYYGTDTRAQSLLVGAALAVSLTLLAQRRASPGDLTSTPSAWRARTVGGRRAFVLVGIIGVGATAALWILVSVDDAFAFRGGFLLAAISTVCVLASVVVAPGSLLTGVLTVSPLRYLGRISYGMYLWHFPLVLWITHANTGLDDVPLFAVRFACTVVIATCVLLSRRTAHSAASVPSLVEGGARHGPGFVGGGRGGRHCCNSSDGHRSAEHVSCTRETDWGALHGSAGQVIARWGLDGPDAGNWAGRLRT